MEQWETLLASYKTDTAAGYAEIDRATGVYTTKKAAGDTAGAEAAHTWANQIRVAMGIAGQYNPVTGAAVTPSAVVAPVVSPAVAYAQPTVAVQPGQTWTPPAVVAPVVSPPVVTSSGQPVVVPSAVVPPTPVVTSSPAVYTPPPVTPQAPIIPPALSPTPAITGNDVGTAMTAQANDPAYVYAQNTLVQDVTLLGQFVKENPWANPDNTQWDRATIDAFTTWSDNYVTQQATEAQAAGIQFDATKTPWWPSYVAMLTARDDLTKVSLKTALDLKKNAIGQQSADVKANYDYQVAEIDNALNMANWASGQQLASSGVILVGMLSWALTANEAKGINEKALAGAERTNYLNKLANDITILTSDYADNGTAMDKATITEIAAQRMLFLTGNQVEYDRTMALATTLKGQRSAINIAAPGIAQETRAAAAKALTQENFAEAASIAQLAQSGITLKKNANGTYNWEVGLSTDQKLTRDQIVFDQWYKVQGLQLDQATLASSQSAQAFQEWATQQGINLDWAQFDWGKTVDQANISLSQAQFDWGKVVDTAGMTLASAQFDWGKVVDKAGMDLNNEEFAFTKWYQTEGINLSKDQLALDTTKNTFFEWATKQGIALDKTKFTWSKYVDQKNIDLATAQQKFTEWYQKEGLKLSKSQLASDQSYQQFQKWATSQGIALDLKQFNWNKQVSTWAHEIDLAGAGGAGGAPVYDPAHDLSLVNSSQFLDSTKGSAPYMRLAAYSGTATENDGVFSDFLNGTPDANNRGLTSAIRWIGSKVNHNVTINPDTSIPGALSLPEADFQEVLQLIKDPVRQGEAYALWAVKNNLYTTTADAIKEVAQSNGWTPQQTTLALKFLGGK